MVGYFGVAAADFSDSSALDPQVNMVIGILVFNKLVSRDGILDKKLKHRAGYDSTSLLVPFFFSSPLTSWGKKKMLIMTGKSALILPGTYGNGRASPPPSLARLLKRKRSVNIKRSDLSRERRGFSLLWQNQSRMKIFGGKKKRAGGGMAGW